MQGLLAQHGYRLAGAASRACRAARQSLRSGLGTPAAESGRSARALAAAAGRRDRDEPASVWGNDWDVPDSKLAGGSSGGWLSTDGGATEEGGRRDRDGGGRDDGGGRGAPQWRDRGSGGAGRGGRGGEWRERREGGRGGEWRERREGGRGDRPAGEWRDRERGGGGRARGGWEGGGGRFSGVRGRGRGAWEEGSERSGSGGSDRDWRPPEREQGGERAGGWEDRRASRGGRGGLEGRGAPRSERGGWEDRGSRAPRGERGGWQSEERGGRGRGRSWEGGEVGTGWEQQQQGPETADGDEYGEAAGASSGLKQFWVGEVLYGVSPVLAALQAGRRTVHALYLQDNMDLSKRKDKGAIQAVKRRAEELGARVEYASKHDLNMLADNRPHQGVMLDCSALEFELMAALPDAPTVSSGGAEGGAAGRLPVWLCLDEVMDPQNFGAALRCAHFLGVDGVLTCHRNSAPLSAVVSKASSGAMELLPVHSTKSLPQTLADARTRGWQVLGASAEQGAVSASSYTLTRPAILVMGNEGYGLRTTVRRLCDTMLQIDGGAGAGAGLGSGLVDSLNVSVATGILLHRLLTAQQPEPAGAAAEQAATGAPAPLTPAAGEPAREVLAE